MGGVIRRGVRFPLLLQIASSLIARTCVRLCAYVWETDGKPKTQFIWFGTPSPQQLLKTDFVLRNIFALSFIHFLQLYAISVWR